MRAGRSLRVKGRCRRLIAIRHRCEGLVERNPCLSDPPRPLYFERYAKLMSPDWTILDDPELFGFLFGDVVDDVAPSSPG